MVKISIELHKIIKIVLKQCDWKEKYKISWIYIFIYEFNKILLYKLKEEYINTKFFKSNMKISNKGTNNHIIEITPIIIAKSYQKNKLIWALREIYTPKNIVE
jgi:cytochrome c1